MCLSRVLLEPLCAKGIYPALWFVHRIRGPFQALPGDGEISPRLVYLPWTFPPLISWYFALYDYMNAGSWRWDFSIWIKDPDLFQGCRLYYSGAWISHMVEINPDQPVTVKDEPDPTDSGKGGGGRCLLVIAPGRGVGRTTSFIGGVWSV